MYRRSRPPIRPPLIELEPPHVPQHLQLLPDLGPDVVVPRIDRRQPPFEPIDVGQGELGPSDILDAFHHVEQPPSRRRRSVAEDGGGAHARRRRVACHCSSTDAFGTCTPSRIRLILPASGTSPIRMLHPCQGALRPFGPGRGLGLDDRLDEEMPRHHDQVGDPRPSAVIAHDHQAGIVPRREARGHRGIGPVQHLAAQPTFLGLKLVFLGADAAMEIRHRRIGREGGQGRSAATGAETMGGDPAFGQDATDAVVRLSYKNASALNHIGRTARHGGQTTDSQDNLYHGV